MRILGRGAHDGGGLTCQGTIEVVEGSWPFGWEDGLKGLAQPFLGCSRQPTGNDRWVEARDLGVEVVWYGQAEAPGQHLVIATCPDVAGFRAQAGSVKPTQGGGGMDVVAGGIDMTGCDPRSAQGMQAHQIELRDDNRMPCFATGSQALWQRQCHVHHSRAICQTIQAVAQGHRIRARDSAADELCTCAEVISG
ncbi:hypothetical protein RM543_12705 [Roseicyclus sp. F158]|uniref:Uncharacterized protein n=1 Tax=Tropicimonas omnivorans TaxID=3075590 RepID=A0ABU3DIM0_9RHOB|nr:hypothetical protein [Roseicyclus sp. F158]MDT0683550.1 hypothetical protein [Roseicyclus sp. F158]